MPTLSQLRRQFETLKCKYARVIAAAHALPAVNQITELWQIALDNKQPKPDPRPCVRMVVDIGFRLQTFTALHIYLEDCRYYAGFPDAQEIIQKLFPPDKPVDLSTVLPTIY